MFKALDAGGPLTTGALDSGDIQIALLFSSQGIIAQKGWVILADDKKLQPVDNLVPVVRTEIASTPGVSEALNKVSAALTTEELSKLNLEVDVDKKDPADVAKEFLTEKNLIGEANGSDGLAGVKVTVGLGELQRARDRRQHVRADPAEQQRGRDDEVQAREP